MTEVEKDFTVAKTLVDALWKKQGLAGSYEWNMTLLTLTQI